MSSNNSLEYFNNNSLEYNNYTTYANHDTADFSDNINPTKFLCSNTEKDNFDKIRHKNEEIQLPSFWDKQETKGMDCQLTPNSKNGESEDEQQELNVSQHLFNSYFNIDTENAKDDLRLQRSYLNSNRFHNYQPTAINLNQFRRLNYEQKHFRGNSMRQNGYHKSPHTTIPKYNNNSSLEPRKLSTSFCSFCKKNNEPFKVYTSHNLRNASHRITCPILSDYICSCCGERGHTLSHCPVYGNRSTILRMINKHNLIKNI